MTHQSVNTTRTEPTRGSSDCASVPVSSDLARHRPDPLPQFEPQDRRWFEIVFPGPPAIFRTIGYRRSRPPSLYGYTLKYAPPCASKYTSAPPCVHPTHHRFLHPNTLMDGLRYLIVAPQLSQTHKKRPRLVTSCDDWCVARSCTHVSLSSNGSLIPSLLPTHSRLKKIKCVQIKSQLCCEACEAGNIPCQFRDRERYFAERSRIVTGASAGSSPAHSRCSSQSTEPSAIPPPTRGDSVSVDASGWCSGAQTSSDHGHPSRYASSSPSYSLSSSPQSNPDQWFSSPLVEPARLHYERFGSSHSRFI
jgi:hypothetical protein